MTGTWGAWGARRGVSRGPPSGFPTQRALPHALNATVVQPIDFDDARRASETTNTTTGATRALPKPGAAARTRESTSTSTASSKSAAAPRARPPTPQAHHTLLNSCAGTPAARC